MTEITKITNTHSYEPNLPDKPMRGAAVVEKPKRYEDVYHEGRILGAVYGSAVGDALGAPAEFKQRSTCLAKWPNGLREMVAGGATGGKDAGSYTDDTEMLLNIGRGIIDAHEAMEPHEYARYINARNLEWANSQPPDMGCLTSGVMSAVRHGHHFYDAAWYHARQGRADANGAIMRNAIVFPFVRCAPHTKQMLVTEEICATTHASHQCRSAAAAMILLMTELCWTTSARKAIRSTYEELQLWGCNELVLKAFERVMNGYYKTAAEVPTSGWVIATFERALWCLWIGAGFEESLVTCVMMGDDADTAGAVCGALLGTFYGYDAIPKDWIVAVEASEAKYRPISLRDLTTKVAEIGDKLFRPAKV